MSDHSNYPEQLSLQKQALLALEEMQAKLDTAERARDNDAKRSQGDHVRNQREQQTDTPKHPGPHCCSYLDGAGRVSQSVSEQWPRGERQRQPHHTDEPEPHVVFHVVILAEHARHWPVVSVLERCPGSGAVLEND
jgi:hypothetical protein